MVVEEAHMERVRSTIPEGLTIEDALSLLDAPHTNTPEPFDAAHSSFAHGLFLLLPISLIVGGAGYAMWSVVKAIPQLPLP
jgi:hypothetical protein